MDETTTKILIAIFTVLGSGIISAIVNHKMTHKQNQKVFLREKAEALYLATHEYRSLIMAYAHSYRMALNEQYSFIDLLKHHASIGERAIDHGGLENITMIVEFYFPAARSNLKNLTNDRENFQSICDRISAYLEDKISIPDDMREEYYNSTNALKDSMKQLMNQIINDARLQSGVKQ